MGLEDHVDVIGSISNRKSDLLWESLLDHVDDVCLLFRGDSTGQHNVNEDRSLDKCLSELWV